MAKVNLDLGQERESYPVPAPGYPESDGEKRYPNFYIELDEPVDLPKEGTMTISFKRVSRSESENSEGEDKYCACIEVRKIVEVEGEEYSAPTKKYDDAASALDAIVAELSKKG